MLALQQKKRGGRDMLYRPETFFLQSYLSDQYLPFREMIEEASHRSQLNVEYLRSNRLVRKDLKQAPLFKREKGRKRLKRYDVYNPSSMNRLRGERSNIGKKNKCSVCNQVGHKRTKCPATVHEGEEVAVMLDNH